MKTILTAAFVAAMACTGIALSQDRTQPDDVTVPPKKVEKKAGIEDVRQMLESMGYTPEKWLDKEGKLIGYFIKIETEEYNIFCDLSLSGNGQNLWLTGNFAKVIDESVPAAVLLKLLELNDANWPASIVYAPAIKKVQVVHMTPLATLNPAAMRTAINNYAKAMKAVVSTLSKVEVKKTQGATSAQ